jgi:hypothetical protein
MSIRSRLAKTAVAGLAVAGLSAGLAGTASAETRPSTEICLGHHDICLLTCISSGGVLVGYAWGPGGTPGWGICYTPYRP